MPYSPLSIPPGLTRERLLAALKAEKARRTSSVSNLDVLDFIPAVNSRYERPDHLAAVANLFERALTEPVRALVSVPPQLGKAVADDTPMWTRRGWVRADEVLVGDELVGSDGQWTRVRGVYPQGDVDLFNVTFACGASLRTCGDHRWAVRDRYTPKDKLRTTSELAADLHEADGRHKWRIPVVSPAVGVECELPIDPYVFGAWLGDGSSYKAELTSADQEIVSAFRSAGYASTYEYPAGAATTLGFRGDLYIRLKALGVLRNKHVPESYLTGAPAQRLAVLQGLADTDGHATKCGTAQSICTTSERLADDIKKLVSSLGGVWREQCRPAAQKTAHNIYVRLPEGVPLFRLDRKQSRMNPFGARSVPRRFVAGVAPAGRGPARCFEVEAADHLFCAGRDLVVTHNTETILYGMARNLARKPWLRNAYATYGAQLARKKSRQCRDLAVAAGVQLRDDAQAVNDWLTTNGGGLLATGVRLPLTGNPIDGMLVIDDPHKDRADADSALSRERVWDWYTSTARSRVHPTGSIVVVHTRWSTDDLIGRLSHEVDEDGKPIWEVINLPAIREDGTTIWHQRPLKFFEQTRRAVGEFDWWSLYMGSPRPRGSSVFRGAKFYDALPARYRIGKGTDLAYTAKTHSDWSVSLVLLEEERPGQLPLYYVADVQREQCDVPTFAGRLAAVDAVWPGAWHWFCSTTEKGVAQLITHGGVRVEAALATADKFVRSQKVAAAWNDDRVLVPRDAPWLKVFLDEVGKFTGVGDRRDDQIDALSSAFETFGGRTAVRPPRASSDYRWQGSGRGF